jgi:hypothetical protein
MFLVVGAARRGGLGRVPVPGPLWLDPDCPDQRSYVASLRVPPWPEASRALHALGELCLPAAQIAMTTLLWAMRLIFFSLACLSSSIYKPHPSAHDPIRMIAYSFAQTKF